MMKTGAFQGEEFALDGVVLVETQGRGRNPESESHVEQLIK